MAASTQKGKRSLFVLSGQVKSTKRSGCLLESLTPAWRAFLTIMHGGVARAALWLLLALFRAVWERTRPGRGVTPRSGFSFDQIACKGMPGVF
jgi:hypothetical protein